MAHDTLEQTLENRYVPLSLLPSHDEADPERDRVTWDFPLPDVDVARILVNSGRLRRIQNLAALQSSHILEEQNQGGIVAAVRPSDIANMSQYSVIMDPPTTPGLKSDFFRSQSSHVFNGDTLNTEVVKKMDLVGQVESNPSQSWRGMSPEKAWAKTLDPVLRSSLREAAQTNLMHRVSPISAESQAAAFILSSMVEGLLVANGGYVQAAYGGGVITGLWGLGVAASAVGNKLVHGSSYLKDFKWSMFRTMQPDRLVGVYALTTGTTPLITVRK